MAGSTIKAGVRKAFSGDQKAYETSSAGISYPPDGEYVVKMCNPSVVQREIKQGPDKGKKFQALNVDYVIVDGPLQGRKFSDSFSNRRNEEGNAIGLARARELTAILNTDEEGNSLGEVADIADGMDLIAEAAESGRVHLLVRVERNTYVDKRTNKERVATNVNVLGPADYEAPEEQK